MRISSAGVNLDLLRSFFAVVEHGSLNKAAAHLRVSQSTLTRQMHALEHDVGGRILERGASGVALTASGRLLFDGTRPLMAKFDGLVEEVSKLARGQSATLRVGYLMSAAGEYLSPALATLRRTNPEVKVRLVDLSPGEQIEALRKGTIDLALVSGVKAVVAREFFVRRVAVLPLIVALPETHRLAARAELRLTDLRGENFIGANDRDMPGNRQWLVQLCRRARFRPRFVAESESLTQALALVVAEHAIALLPAYSASARVPGVAFRPLRAAGATAELLVAWQRGKATGPVLAMLAALPTAGKPAART